METTGKGITDTLTEGLELVRRTGAYRKAIGLGGALELEIDLDESPHAIGGSTGSRVHAPLRLTQAT